MLDAIKSFYSGLFSMGAGLLGLVLKAAVIAALGYLVIRLVLQLLDKMLEKSKLERAAFSLIKTVAKIVMIVLLALIVASSLGLDVTGVVALASVVSLAVSLALQDMLANVVGGFTILYTHPFHAGDYVEIAGQGGTVKEVGIAYTRITTPDNKLVSIPNSAVVAAEIVNYTTTGTRRVEIPVSASYNCPPEDVIRTLLMVGQDARVLEDPAPFAGLTGYGDSAITYCLRVWVKSDDYWDVYFDLNRKVKATFDAQGLEMTYPHMNVHLDGAVPDRYTGQ